MGKICGKHQRGTATIFGETIEWLTGNEIGDSSVDHITRSRKYILGAVVENYVVTRRRKKQA